MRAAFRPREPGSSFVLPHRVGDNDGMTTSQEMVDLLGLDARGTRGGAAKVPCGRLRHHITTPLTTSMMIATQVTSITSWFASPK